MYDSRLKSSLLKPTNNKSSVLQPSILVTSSTSPTSSTLKTGVNSSLLSSPLSSSNSTLLLANKLLKSSSLGHKPTLDVNDESLRKKKLQDDMSTAENKKLKLLVESFNPKTEFLVSKSPMLASSNLSSSLIKKPSLTSSSKVINLKSLDNREKENLELNREILSKLTSNLFMTTNSSILNDKKSQEFDIFSVKRQHSDEKENQMDNDAEDHELEIPESLMRLIESQMSNSVSLSRTVKRQKTGTRSSEVESFF